MATRALLALALALALVAAAAAHDRNKHKQMSDDPFALMDQIMHAVFPPRIKLWPWHDIFQEDPKLISDKSKCEFDLYVKRFSPEQLRVKVKNRFITVEGRKEATGDLFLTNRFVQNFALPPGCKEDELTAEYSDGVLSVSAPKHELPPPPPERIIPIRVVAPAVAETTTSKEEDKPEDDSTEQQDKKQETTTTTSTAAPIERLDQEATTTHGKIQKKELKTTTKTTKDNEVNKNENALDYADADDVE